MMKQNLTFKIIVVLLTCFFALPLGAQKRVDIVSYRFDLLPYSDKSLAYKYLNEHYKVSYHYDLHKYIKNFKCDSRHLQKIIFFEYCVDPYLYRLPKKKLVCFKWEA